MKNTKTAWSPDPVNPLINKYDPKKWVGDAYRTLTPEEYVVECKEEFARKKPHPLHVEFVSDNKVRIENALKALEEAATQVETVPQDKPILTSIPLDAFGRQPSNGVELFEAARQQKAANVLPVPLLSQAVPPMSQPKKAEVGFSGTGGTVSGTGGTVSGTGGTVSGTDKSPEEYLKEGKSIREIEKLTGVSRSAVQRLKKKLDNKK